MQAFRIRAALAVILTLALTACGGSKNPASPGGSGGGSHFMRATIDGSSWSSSSTLVNLGVNHSQPGLYIMTGGGTTGYSIVLDLYNISGPGTYPLGVGISVAGGIATLSQVNAGWSTALTGVSGTVTITDLSDTHIAGTFSFTATPLSGGATGAKSVTAGSFDLAVKTSGNPGPVPDNAASKVSATLGGSAFNAANVASTYSSSSGTLGIAANTIGRSLTITLLSVTAPGTYTLPGTSGTNSIAMTGDGSDPGVCCWGSAFSGGGTVVVSAITATRIRGTFTATLKPAPGAQATGTVEATQGVFDIGYVALP
jgi:hypothetical protein